MTHCFPLVNILRFLGLKLVSLAILLLPLVGVDLAIADVQASAPLSCGLNPRMYHPENLVFTGQGRTAAEADASAMNACLKHGGRAKDAFEAYNNSLRCPERCPDKQTNITYHWSCFPTHSNVTCDPSEKGQKKMKAFCKEIIKGTNLPIDVCMNYLCSDFLQPWFALAELYFSFTGFIICS